MLQKLSLIVLAPLLIWQGRQVRKNTLRLPEAAGEREGARKSSICGKSNHIRLLILGDSAAAGVGCDTQDEAVCGQLVARAAQTYSVDWQLWAQSSLTCAGILQLAQQQPETEPFDLVLISAGVNDVTRRTSLTNWRHDLQALTQYLTEQRGAKRIIFTGLPPMHKFPALPQPLRWFVGQQARRLDDALRVHCQQSACEYLELDLPFAPEYMAKDGFHPSAKAAKLWADAIQEI
ncbi:hypothetical protein CWI82_09845 [Pseudidiomarina tainanensis]|uniref:Uncharacterized protein n=1 Tax=Pseudidiomarina tainanensis TaxID=502365 RepID=A0ACD2HGI8_9GAMM|nr:SGNH/GDSL hydrolase family protein [Pseudidiomarina tainanensis]RZQ55668.1 hypothetical protein CWI82_09845 [Pseudidiomarina tainanensis]